MSRRSVQRDLDLGLGLDRDEKPKRVDSLVANYWWELV
jgi:hypothetical protein